MAVLARNELENGGKIILPPSALDHLTRLHIDYPMLFKVTNTKHNVRTHCGVLEFVAEEGRCYLPYWMMEQLLLQEGDFITITSATLQKGQYVKLQPHSTSFLDISNPRAVLEMAFRAYSTLTVGDTIKVEYNAKTYLIDVLEVKPENLHQAITIVEADVQVDFAPPLDYVEPTRPQPVVETPIASEESQEKVEEEEEIDDSFKSFTGTYHTLSGRPPRQIPGANSLSKSAPAPGTVKPLTTQEKEEFVFKTREVPKAAPTIEKKRKRRRRGDPINQEPEEEPVQRPLTFSGKAYSLR